MDMNDQKATYGEKSFVHISFLQMIYRYPNIWRNKRADNYDQIKIKIKTKTNKITKSE